MAKSAKRRRQLARQRWERQQARRTQAARRRRRATAVAGVFVLVVALVGGALLVTGAFEDDTVAAGSESGDGSQSAGDCKYRETGSPAVPGIGTPGPLPAEDAQVTTATLTINGSPVTVELDPGAAPCAVHSFDFLAKADYFDDTTCHRLTTTDDLKVLQCGDPTGTGSGGPGYEFDDEITEGAPYKEGVVAMANSGPDTNGSQFFLVYGDSKLPSDYTIFGEITKGLDVIDDIAAAGTDNGSDDSAPKEPVTLDDVTTASANPDEDSQ